MFTLIKLKKLEKHYVVYQENICVAKAGERDGVDIPAKEARKEHVFVFSVLFHNVSNHKVLSSYRKKNPTI